MISPFSDEQIKILQAPINPNRVKHRQGGGGVQYAYLKGHDVIDIANEIFGFGNWGYDLLSVELNSIPGGGGEIIQGYYSARVKVQVAGCIPVTEEGVCAIQEGRNNRAIIDAHDMARKGAITDALKRALRCFGDQFGNSLYDTDLVDGQADQPRQNNASQSRNYNAPSQRPVTPQNAPRSSNTPVSQNGGRVGLPTAPTSKPAPAPAPGTKTLQDFKLDLVSALGAGDKKKLFGVKNEATGVLTGQDMTQFTRMFAKAFNDPEGFLDEATRPAPAA